MNIALTLLLLAQPTRNWSVPLPMPTFDLMLDSAYIVVIAKVDSMWYSMHSGRAWTNYSAEILALYAKNDSLPLPKCSIRIVNVGGEYPDGSFEEVTEQPSFKIGEIFLASIEECRALHSETERAYQVPVYWKYTISGDSLWILDAALQSSKISIADAVSALSSHFIKVGQ